MHDKIAITLNANAQKFLQEKKYWYVIQHINVLLDSLNAKLFSLDTAKILLSSIIKNIETLLTHKAIHPLKAANTINKSLRIEKLYPGAMEKLEKENLKTLLNERLSWKNIEGSMVNSPRQHNEELSVSNEVIKIKQSYQSRLETVYLLLEIMQEKTRLKTASKLSEKKLLLCIDLIKHLTNKLISEESFDKAISYLNKLSQVAIKFERPDVGNYCQLELNKINLIFSDRALNSNQNNFPRNQQTVQPSIDIDQVDFVLQLLGEDKVLPSVAIRIFDLIFTFHKDGKLIGDVAGVYNLLENSVVLADEMNLSQIKHKFELVLGDFLIQASGESEDNSPIKSLPPFNQILQSLRNYFDVLSPALKSRDMIKINTINQKITSLEAKFIYQTAHSFIVNHLLSKISNHPNEFEESYQVAKKLAEQLFACGEYDLSWSFYANVKALLTQQAKEWHGKLLNELDKVSNALIQRAAPSFSVKGQWQESQEKLFTCRNNLFSSLGKENFEVKQQAFTLAVIELVREWLIKNEELIGLSPVKFCLFGLGSMSRQRMSLYSDCECGIIVKSENLVSALVEPDTDEAKYIDVFYSLFEFKINCIGEIRGFRLDQEGHPRKELRLIGTPDGLLQKNLPSALGVRIDDEITYSLLNTCYIYGEKSLLTQFQQLLNSRLDMRILTNNPAPWRKLLVDKFLSLHIKELTGEFNVDSLPNVMYEKGINIKKYYIAPMMYAMGDICLYYRIPFVDTISALKYLKAEKKIDSLWAEAYKNAVVFLDALRVRLQAFYQEQEDIGYPLQAQVIQKYKLTLEEEKTLQLINIAILKPVTFALKELKNGNDQYLLYPAHVSLLKLIHADTNGGAVSIELVAETIRSIIATIILTKRNEQDYALTYLLLSQKWREIFKNELNKFKFYFDQKKWQKLHAELLNVPYPNGDRDVTKFNLQEWNSVLNHMLGDGPDSINLTWVSEEGKIETKSLHPRLIEYLREKRFIDKKNELIKTKSEQTATSGRHMVLPIRLEIEGKLVDVHIKFFPELPAMECVSGKLAHLLAGWGAPFVKIAKLNIDKQSYPILISQTIPGRLLHELFHGENVKNIDQLLDDKAYSQRFFLALCLNQEDAKPGNFIAETFVDDEENQKIGLVCFDNDRSFFPALTEEEGKIVPIVKDITFCFEKIREVIHSTVQAELLSIDPYELLNNWLSMANHISQEMQLLFAQTEMLKWFPKQSHGGFLKGLMGKDDLIRESVLGMTIRSQTLSKLYTKLNRTQDFLRKAKREGRSVTHLELLRYTEPYLSKYYQNLLDDYPTIDERFHCGFSLLYGEKREESGSHQTKKTTFASLHTMHGRPVDAKDFKVQQERSVHEAIKELELIHRIQQTWRNILSDIQAERVEGLTEFNLLNDVTIIETIVNMLDFKNFKSPQFIEKLIQTMIDMKTSFNVLKLINCPIRDDQLEQLLMSSEELQVLHLERCPNVSGNIVVSIAKYCHIIESLSITSSPLKYIDNSNSLIPQLFTPIGSKATVVLGELRFLDLSNCFELVELQLTAKRLAKINLENCRQLKKVRLNSKSLEYLNVQGCALLTNDRLSEFVTDAPKLKEIKTLNCPNIKCAEFYADFPYLLPVDVSVYTTTFREELVMTLKRIMPPKLTKDAATRALKTLLEFKTAGDNIKSSLLKLIRHDSPDVVQDAVLTFGKLGRNDADIISDLTKCLSHHSNVVAQAAAISLFELEIRNDRILAYIRSGLSSTEEKVVLSAVRVIAINDMREDYPRIISIILKFLNESNTQKRIEGIHLASYLIEPPPQLIEALQQQISYSEPEVIANAIYVLGYYACHLNKVIELRKAIKDFNFNDPVTYQRALRLAIHNDLETHDFLKEQYQVFLTSPPVVNSILLQKLQSENWGDQIEALNELNRTKQFNAVAINLAAELLNSLRSNVRAVAALYIANSGYGNKDIQAKLLLLLDKDSDRLVRLQAVKALGASLDEGLEAVKVLCKLMLNTKDEDKSVRMVAAESLAFKGDFSKETINVLVQGAGDKYTDVILSITKSMIDLISFNTLNKALNRLNLATEEHPSSSYHKKKSWKFSAQKNVLQVRSHSLMGEKPSFFRNSTQGSSESPTGLMVHQPRRQINSDPSANSLSLQAQLNTQPTRRALPPPPRLPSPVGQNVGMTNSKI